MISRATIVLLLAYLALACAVDTFDAVAAGEFQQLSAAAAAEKINITLYIESYCPFCKKFVKKDLKKLMDSDLKDMVDVHLEPGVFAQKTKNKKGKMKWSCLHGKKECKLDRIQLCAMKKYKDQAVWWPFIECIEAAKGKKKEGLKSVDKCAKDNKIDGAAVKKCGEGDEGEKLLKAQQAKEDAFLAEPATKVFVKKNAEDTFKQAVAQAYDTLGSNEKAVANLKKVFEEQLKKLTAKPKKAKKDAKKDKDAPPKRGFVPYVPLFTITTGGKQKIIELGKDPKVTAISAVCDVLTVVPKPAVCTTNSSSSSSSSTSLAKAKKATKDKVAAPYKGVIKAAKKDAKDVIAKIEKVKAKK